MWLVIVVDFVLLNTVIILLGNQSWGLASWGWSQLRMFFIISNAALLVGEWKFHTLIHQRLVSAAEVLRSIFMLTMTQALLSYMLMRHVLYWMASGRMLFYISSAFFVLLLISRLIERIVVKRMRRLGRNTRTVTLVGSDNELRRVYEQMLEDPTTGYRVEGYYADEIVTDSRIPWLGKVNDLLEADGTPLGDEMYVCLPRREGETIRALSQLCDRQVTKFYYVPVSVESIGLRLNREYINDIEVFTTHESPLENPLNKAAKRVLDIIVSMVALAFTGLLFPFVYIIIKMQSPGPIFFKQLRTGMDGKDFVCYKFRSMHVNDSSEKLQATKDDPRKFSFGNFMRKTNIDEFPQFWNVLKGNMSVVGPRPHMLLHTDMYSRQIGEYMVRHFVKPGITGWAQVTGFRGETKELWQMEERVRRDIWYMENWSIWLDIRIVWMTMKTMFRHDENAY
jgi:putative colanic acid biosynthesis UDP-glucose lipid carrier transferase